MLPEEPLGFGIDLMGDIKPPVRQLRLRRIRRATLLRVPYFSVFGLFEGPVSFSEFESPLSIRFRTLMSFPSALRQVARLAQQPSVEIQRLRACADDGP